MNAVQIPGWFTAFAAADTARNEHLRDVDANDQLGALSVAIEAAVENLGVIEIIEAGQAYLKAKTALRDFENEFPNDSTKRWDNLLYAVEAAEARLRDAVLQAA